MSVADLQGVFLLAWEDIKSPDQLLCRIQEWLAWSGLAEPSVPPLCTLPSIMSLRKAASHCGIVKWFPTSCCSLGVRWSAGGVSFGGSAGSVESVRGERCHVPCAVSWSSVGVERICAGDAVVLKGYPLCVYLVGYKVPPQVTWSVEVLCS
jgi:hypothetical protein